MLEALAPALGDIETTVLVATGAHRGATEEEYSRILGRQHSRLRPRASSHDARDASCLIDLGRTSRGTPVLLNRLAAEADRVIATGSVEPHYFAGFTGGRKAFFPGVAGFATIEANHRLALDSRAASLALGGNPVHEDLVEALSFVTTPVFALMAVLDGEQRVAAAAAGDIAGSFAAAVAEARRIFSVPVPRRASVVLSVAREPMDIDLYQSQKAIDNGAAALADGGTLILLSSCREGLGDKEYAALLASSADPAAALEAIGSGYRLGWHKAAKMAQVSARATVQAKTELDGKLLRSLFIEPVVDLQEAVDRALARTVPGCAPGLILLPDGCLTVPDPAGRPQAS
jgi:nickel-dependent lactate racemase